MRSKTKIIVLHLKELIYTGILLVLGVGLLFLLLQIFLPKRQFQNRTMTQKPPCTCPENTPPRFSSETTTRM